MRRTCGRWTASAAAMLCALFATTALAQGESGLLEIEIAAK